MRTKQNTFLQETVGLQPFDAIQLKHYTRVQFFLRNELDANLRDQKRRTLLMSACCLVEEKTALKFSNLLLKYKARIDLQDEIGLNALHYAVLNEHEHLVARFLEFAGNFDINRTDSFGNTALMLAVFTRNYDIVKKLVLILKKYELSVDKSNYEGISPLILATLLQQDETAACLIEDGKASTEIRDKHFRKSAKEWQHGTQTYPFVLKGSPMYNSVGKYSTKTCPPACQDPLKEDSTPYISNPTLKRAILRNPSEYINYPSHVRSERLLKRRPKENLVPSNDGAYRYPDLKPVYNLYEQELASSYRKSVPPRAKTPPASSSESLDSQRSWRNAILSLKLKQRRHTISLSRSLPSSISKNLFGPPVLETHARSYSMGTSEAFESSKWSKVRQNTRQNSFRLPYGNIVPATAPGVLATNHRRASVSMDTKHQRRRSVSFQSLHISPRDFGAQSPHMDKANLNCSKSSEENNFPAECTIIEEDVIALDKESLQKVQ